MQLYVHRQRQNRHHWHLATIARRHQREILKNHRHYIAINDLRNGPFNITQHRQVQMTNARPIRDHTIYDVWQAVEIKMNWNLHNKRDGRYVNVLVIPNHCWIQTMKIVVHHQWNDRKKCSMASTAHRVMLHHHRVVWTVRCQPISQNRSQNSNIWNQSVRYVQFVEQSIQVSIEYPQQKCPSLPHHSYRLNHKMDGIVRQSWKYPIAPGCRRKMTFNLH